MLFRRFSNSLSVISILLVLICSGCSTVFSMRPANSLRSLFHLTLKSSGPIGSPEFEKTLDTYTDSQLIPGNSLAILENGNTYFSQLLTAVDAAESYIDIAMYDYTVDNIGSKVLDHLISALNRGVKVRITYDKFGCETEVEDFADFTAAGGEVLVFNPLKGWTFLRMNNRNHRKIVIIDGNKAFISGMNISDNYNGNGFDGWRDSGILIHGPAVYNAELLFAQCWNNSGKNWLGMNLPFVGGDTVKSIIDYPFVKLFGNLYTPQKREIQPQGDVAIRLVEQSPENVESNLINLFTIAINAAQKSVYISTPYFLPTSLIQNALLAAAKRGVDVRILTQYDSDLKLFTELAHGELHVYKKHGIRIWGWDKSVLHNKLAIIDGKLVIGGSVNLDARSLLMNYEVAFCTENKAVIMEYMQTYLNDLNLARELSYEDTLKMITPKNLLYAPLRNQM